MNNINDLVKRLQQYNKLWVALAGGVVTVLTELYGIDNVYVQMLVSGLTALGVWGTPNLRVAKK